MVAYMGNGPWGNLTTKTMDGLGAGSIKHVPSMVSHERRDWRLIRGWGALSLSRATWQTLQTNSLS